MHFYSSFILLYIIFKLQRPNIHSVSKNLVATATELASIYHLRTEHKGKWIPSSCKFHF